MGQKWLYSFRRPEPLKSGPMTDRDKYFVYADSREEAFMKFRKALEVFNEEAGKEVFPKHFEPEYLGRERT